jgi:hypothetical protein
MFFLYVMGFFSGVIVVGSIAVALYTRHQFRDHPDIYKSRMEHNR